MGVRVRSLANSLFGAQREDALAASSKEQGRKGTPLDRTKVRVECVERFIEREFAAFPSPFDVTVPACIAPGGIPHPSGCLMQAVASTLNGNVLQSFLLKWGMLCVTEYQGERA
jgi:hypothetical protein